MITMAAKAKRNEARRIVKTSSLPQGIKGVIGLVCGNHKI
jgi:hypothetical protein